MVTQFEVVVVSMVVVALDACRVDVEGTLMVVGTLETVVDTVVVVVDIVVVVVVVDCRSRMVVET